jgi:hypothetical protein
VIGATVKPLGLAVGTAALTPPVAGGPSA